MLHWCRFLKGIPKPRAPGWGIFDLSWISTVYRYEEEEVLEVAGWDAVVYLRTLRFGASLIASAFTSPNAARILWLLIHIWKMPASASSAVPHVQILSGPGLGRRWAFPLIYAKLSIDQVIMQFGLLMRKCAWCKRTRRVHFTVVHEWCTCRYVNAVCTKLVLEELQEPVHIGGIEELCQTILADVAGAILFAFLTVWTWAVVLPANIGGVHTSAHTHRIYSYIPPYPWQEPVYVAILKSTSCS